MNFSLKSKKNQSLLVSILIIILFFYIGFKLLDANKTSSNNIIKHNIVVDPEEISNPTITLDRFARNSVINGKIIWELTGDTGKYFDESSSAKISNPKLKYFKDTGLINLVAKTAVVYFEGQGIKLANLKDDVVIKEPNYILKTIEASYFQEENKITAPRAVKIESDKFDIIGDELRIDTASQDVFYNANVKSKIFNVSIKNSTNSENEGVENETKTEKIENNSEKSAILIDSNKFNINNNTGNFSYQENVLATQNEFSIKADMLNGKLVNATTTDQQGVEELKAIGNVVLTQGKEMTAYSQFADFDLDKKIVTLTGNPKVERVDNIITADIIYYYLEEERSVAEGNVEVLMKEEKK